MQHSRSGRSSPHCLSASVLHASSTAALLLGTLLLVSSSLTSEAPLCRENTTAVPQGVSGARELATNFLYKFAILFSSPLAHALPLVAVTIQRRSVTAALKSLCESGPR